MTDERDGPTADGDRPTPNRPDDTHAAVRVLLGASVLGLLRGDERRTVEDHLLRCEACRREVARLAPLPALLHRTRAFDSASGGAGETAGGAGETAGGAGETAGGTKRISLAGPTERTEATLGAEPTGAGVGAEPTPVILGPEPMRVPGPTVAAEATASDTAGPPVPVRLPDGVVAAAQHQVARRRRWRRTAGIGAAAAALAVVGLAAASVLVRSSSATTTDTGALGPVTAADIRHLALHAVHPPTPPSGVGAPGVALPSTTAGRSGPPAPSGKALLVARPWGTEVVLTVVHMPAETAVHCVVIGADGSTMAGSWDGTSTGRAEVTMAVGLRPPAVRDVEVLTAKGEVLLRSS
jgi:hypothetical protein